MALSPDFVGVVARRTENVSAAFVKELMRRSVQFHIERDGTGPLEVRDAEAALDEMLFHGGSLNLALLGGTGIPTSIPGERPSPHGTPLPE